MALSDYERRMWAELEARLTSRPSPSDRFRSVARKVRKAAAVLAVAVAALLVATALGEATSVAIGLALRGGRSAIALIGLAAIAAGLLLHARRPQRS